MWQEGRQGSGYQKLLLIQSAWPIAFDLYLLRYPEGAYILRHVDQVPKDFKHYRLNIFLRKSTSGGEFKTDFPTILSTRFFEFFRPDVNPHWVTLCKGKTRYVLSLGFLRKMT